MRPQDKFSPTSSTAVALYTSAPKGSSKAAPEPTFTAQVMGSTGARRGLRGGAQVLDAAKSTYLETEWSGEADRRTPIGGKARKKV